MIDWGKRLPGTLAGCIWSSPPAAEAENSSGRCAAEGSTWTSSVLQGWSTWTAPKGNPWQVGAWEELPPAAVTWPWGWESWREKCWGSDGAGDVRLDVMHRSSAASGWVTAGGVELAATELHPWLVSVVWIQLAKLPATSSTKIWYK